MTTVSSKQSIAQALEYWRVVRSYKWFVLVAGLTLTLVLTVIIAAQPNIYEATTTILVDPQQIPEKYVSPAVSSDAYSRLNTITQQVLSRTRLQEIIDKSNLYPESRNLKSVSPEEIIDRMRSDVSIQVKQGSGPELSTFTITYQGKNPILVAQVANELAASFIQWNVNSRAQQVSGTKDFLSSELETAKRNLEAQEDKLRQFKMSHLGETPDQTANNLQVLAGLRASLQANAEAINRLDEERILLTRLPAQASTVADPRVVTLTEHERLELEKRQLETEIRQLRGHYSDRYPDVVKATHRLQEIDTQLKSISAESADQSFHGKTDATSEQSSTTVRLEIIDKEMSRLKAEQSQIQSQMSAYQAKVDASPLREQQLIELNRNYDISKQHYQALLDKSFSADMAVDLEQKQKAERFRVLDPAQVPVKPVKPRRKLLIPGAGLFAFGLSIFLVVAREVLNPAIKTELELKSLIPAGANIIGLIPRIEVPEDVFRQRQRAVWACVVCVLLFLVLAAVIFRIRPLL